jgi:hypothetical protein
MNEVLFRIGDAVIVAPVGSGVIDVSVKVTRWLAWSVNWASRDQLRGKRAAVLDIGEICCAGPNKHVRLESSVR